MFYLCLLLLFSFNLDNSTTISPTGPFTDGNYVVFQCSFVGSTKYNITLMFECHGMAEAKNDRNSYTFLSMHVTIDSNFNGTICKCSAKSFDGNIHANSDFIFKILPCIVSK